MAKFWLIPAGSTLCFVIIAIGLFFFCNCQLTPEDEEALLRIAGGNFVSLAVAVGLTLAILICGLLAIFRWYVAPTRKITDEMMIIHSANPSYRIDINSVRNFSRLATLVNETADRYQSLKDSVDERILLAGESLEEEKNILASIISCLSEAVVVCNPLGNILLFNKKTDELLSPREGAETALSTPTTIGINRNISRYINESQINHAFSELTEKIARKENDPGTCFSTLGPAGHFLKVEIVPILINENELAGYVLRVHVVAYPLVHPAAVSSSLQVAPDCRPLPAAIANPPLPSCNLVLFPTQLQKLLVNFQHRVEGQLNLALQLTVPKEPAWIYADIPSLASALVFLSAQIKDATGAKDLECLAEIDRDYIRLDIIWSGTPLNEKLVDDWSNHDVFQDDGNALRLGDILTKHDAEWWSSIHRPSPTKASLLIFIPSAEPFRARTITPITLATSRPEFYDFDLLHRPDTSPDLQEQLLANLSYTVIDTETTGLDPYSDDIISIAAVRIVNGRLLRDGVFNMLVDPQRELPEKSIKIHGIRPEMLQGQPTIEKVLPRLYQYTGNTVLVGHNVAFDMRMFQVKEYIAPVRFKHPVLDIMFLSAVIHPSQRRHSLEAISERLGITITGRHTALGDAFATAEILLKCIPILARNNILTLKDAVQASQKTKYAKLSY